MHYFLSLAAAAALVSATNSTGPGYVAFPVQKITKQGNGTSKASAKSVSGNSHPIFNTYEQYLASFSIGTPPQAIVASIDTGSSDLWVYQSGASYDYNPKLSSTSQFVNDDFSIEYVDGSSAKGSYWIDELTWGPTTVNVQFAVDPTYTGENPTGVFGIALKGDEATDVEYDNYPYQLKDQGVIQSTSYSLYLDDAQSSSGTLLFGALDTSKYTGALGVVPLTADYEFQVAVTAGGVNFKGVLDAGTSYTYLPTEAANNIANSLGATWNDVEGAYQAPAVLPDQGVTYNFSGTEVTVPKSELWAQIGADDNYYLTIFPWTESSFYVLLGDTFLRSAYVVYDLDNYTIGIAQSNWNPGPPNYEVIGPAGIAASV